MMISTDKSGDEKIKKLLTQEFPMRVKRVGDDVYASTVRETQASPMELAGLLNDLRMTLHQRAARARPLCHVREDLLRCLARELLRQLIIDCPERGLLFKQVLEEHYKYIESYKVLMQHNDAFMCRKNLQAFHTKSTQLTRIQYLEDEIDVLKHQAKALKEAAERLEKKYQEDRIRAENQRQNEIRYLRQLGEQLKTAVSAVPNQRGLYREVFGDWMDEVDGEEKEDVPRFFRVARMPTDFSFNSDLALLRRMINENRLYGHKLLAFGK
ncbi:33 kDa inner dynein arm light chain axonemal [Taenia solium]|eukprot:TsM_000886800 transcript=TsM_000886800 gene=TsM_000886800